MAQNWEAPELPLPTNDTVWQNSSPTLKQSLHREVILWSQSKECSLVIDSPGRIPGISSPVGRAWGGGGGVQAGAGEAERRPEQTDPRRGVPGMG